MNKLSLLLFSFLFSVSPFLQAQVADEVEKTSTSVQQKTIKSSEGQWFIALIGGIAFQPAESKYSVASEHLTNSSAGASSPFIGAKFGYRYKNKHQGAFIFEKSLAVNSFAYTGVGGTGLGVNRSIDYLFANVEYSYNLMTAKRFWFGPSVQLGIGVGDNSSSDFYDRGREQYLPIPNGVTYHKYEIIRAEIPKMIFNYGLGISFGAEVIKDKFYIGTDLRWLHSFTPVHEYEIAYQNDSNYLNFTAESPLMNIHWGLQLAYLF